MVYLAVCIRSALLLASSCWTNQEQNRPCNRGDGNCISKRCFHYVLPLCSSLRIPASDEGESHGTCTFSVLTFMRLWKLGSWEFVFTDVA